MSPVRKIYYNITTTGLSIFVAFAIGTVEIVGLIIDKAGLTGQPWDFIAGIDINLAGRIIVGIFLIVWIGAVLNWKWRKLDEKYGNGDKALLASGQQA